MRMPAAPARSLHAAARAAVRVATVGTSGPAVAVALATAGLAGCASRGPASPAPEPRPMPPSGAVPTPSAPPVAERAGAFTWAPAPVVRRLEVRTEIEILDGGAPGAPGAPGAGGDAPERVRTVVALADTVSAGGTRGAARAAGIVEAFAAEASTRVQGVAAPPPFIPFAYRAFSDAGGVRAEPVPGAGVDLRCAAPGGPAALATLAAVRETLPRVPADAAPGARWRDTTVSATCAGPVLLVVQTASQYEAATGEGGALAVVRRSTTTLRGQGAAGVRPVSVAGTGSGETRYLLDPARGTLLSALGESRTTLALTVAGASRRLTQHARTQVTPRR